MTNVTSLLKTVKAVEDEATRGTRALEATIECIKQELAVRMVAREKQRGNNRHTEYQIQVMLGSADNGVLIIRQFLSFSNPRIRPPRPQLLRNLFARQRASPLPPLKLWPLATLRDRKTSSTRPTSAAKPCQTCSAPARFSFNSTGTTNEKSAVAEAV